MKTLPDGEVVKVSTATSTITVFYGPPSGSLCHRDALTALGFVLTADGMVDTDSVLDLPALAGTLTTGETFVCAEDIDGAGQRLVLIQSFQGLDSDVRAQLAGIAFGSV